MKKKTLFISIFWAFLPFILSAQIFVDGKNINEMKDEQYLLVTYWSKNAIVVTYSDSKSPSTLQNAKGEKVRVKNEVDCLNYFYKNGWELQTQSQAGYTFKRRKEEKAQ